MTVLDDARPVPPDAARTVPPRGAPDGRPSPFRSVRAGLCRLRTGFALRFGTGRNPDAGRLTDGQLADIGLTRFDLPAHRGRRR